MQAFVIIYLLIALCVMLALRKGEEGSNSWWFCIGVGLAWLPLGVAFLAAWLRDSEDE